MHKNLSIRHNYLLLLYLALTYLVLWGIGMGLNALWLKIEGAVQALCLIGSIFMGYAVCSLLIAGFLRIYSHNGLLRFIMVNKFVRMLFILTLLLIYTSLQHPSMLFVVAVTFVHYFVTLIIESIYFVRIDTKPQQNENFK